ncbi:MAG: GrpB family protein [Candidatus Elarobacter sp.]
MSDGRTDPTSPNERANALLVAPYDAAWPAAFALLRDRIAPVLGELAVGIEHVGSTAVPNCAAKPILDIDVVMRYADDLDTVALRLEHLGYVRLGDLGIAGREAFRAAPGLPRHHLGVCAAGSAVLRSHLTLRDALRADPELAAAYGALKRELAERYRHDQDSYTEGKTAFITTVLLDVREGRRRALRRW